MEGLLTAGAAAATLPMSLSSPQLSDAREQTHENTQLGPRQPPDCDRAATQESIKMEDT